MDTALKDNSGTFLGVCGVGMHMNQTHDLSSEEQFNTLREELNRAVEEWEGARIKKLSVSCGYASSREFPSVNITELSQISDDRMYAAKAEYYRNSGIDRRKT